MNQLIFTKWLAPVKSWGIFLLLLLLSIFILLPHRAAAQENSRINISIEAGFDKYYKEGEAVPVYVTVSNEGTAVDGYIQITAKAVSNDGLLYRAPVTLATQSNKRIDIPVQFARQINGLRVELWDGNTLLAAAETDGTLKFVTRDTFLYGVVTSSIGDFDFLERANGRFTNAEVAYLTIADLPQIAPVWSGLDMLIFDDVDTAALSTVQQAGLNSWLENGGQLMITGGAGWQKTTAVFSDILPVTVHDTAAVDDLSTLSERFALPFRDEGPYLLNKSSLQTGGELLLHQNGQPLLARRAIGAGHLYFLSLDPKLAPLLDWDGAPLIWEMLQNDTPENPHTWERGFQTLYAAESAVSLLPSLALPSTFLLIFFLFLYISTIGPVNYIVLRRRDDLARAWITIPVISLGFSVIAYFIGFQLKGNDTIINELSVLIGHTETETARVESIIGLYSPRRDTYDLVFPYNTVAVPLDVTAAIPMASVMTDSSSRIDSIARDTTLTMENVRVDIGNMELFTAKSYQPMPAISGHATLTRGDGDALLNVVLTNESDIQLERATLIIGSRVYEMDDFGDDGRITFSRTYASAPVNLHDLSIFQSASDHPLQDNNEVILRTAAYYDDIILRAQYELINAIEPERDYSSTVMPLYQYRTDTITLLAWADESQLNSTLADEKATVYHTTLYLIDIPLMIAE